MGKHKILDIVVIGLVFIISTSSLNCTKRVATPSPAPNSKIEVSVPDNSGVKIKVGDIAPDFILKNIDGKTMSLGDFRGNKVVINMWWMRCHGCTDEMPYFQEFYQKWKDRGLVLMAVNVYDSDAMITAFADSKGLTFPLLIDTGKKLNKAYTNCGVPTTFFIDGDGVVKAIKDGGFGNDSEIEDMYQSY